MNKKAIISLAIIVGLIPSISLAEIAYDNSAAFTLGSYTTSWSNNFTVTGNNTYLFVSLRNYGQAGQANCNGTTVSYNGTALTNLTRFNVDVNTSVWSFYGQNGTGDGAAHSLTWAQGGGQCAPIAMSISSYSGAKQQAPEATNTAGGSSNSITTIANKSWVIGGCGNGCSAGTGTNLRVSDAGTDAVIVESSSNPITPAGSVTINTTGNTTLSSVSLESDGLAPAGKATCRIKAIGRCH